MKLSELYLNRYLYRSGSETLDSVEEALDASPDDPSFIVSGGAAQDLNTGNVMVDPEVLPPTSGSDVGYNVKILDGHIELRDGITPLAYFGLTADGSAPPDISGVDGVLSVATLNGYQINGPLTQALVLDNGYGSSLFSFGSGGFISVFNILGSYNGNFLLSTYGSTPITYNTGFEDVDVNYSSTKSLLTAGHSLSPVSGINMGLGGGIDANSNWSSVSISGTNIVAVIRPGRLYFYNGSIWAELQPAGDTDYNWSSVSISGNNIVAGIYGGRIYYYDGATWTEQQPAGNVDKNWSSVSISGTNIIAGIYNGRIYYYNGATWAEVQPAGNTNQNWSSVSIDGTKIIAGIYQGRLYYYNGASWSEQQPAGAANKQWTSVSISGTNIIACVYAGFLYFYNGSSWSAQYPAGVANKNWNCVSISGTKMMAGIGAYPTPGVTGKLYYYDGATWAEQQPDSTIFNYNWRSVSIDGDNIIAGAYGGKLYYYDGATWAEQQVVGSNDYWYWLLLKPNVSPPSYTNSASLTYYKSGVTTQFRGVMEATGAIYSFDLTVV